MAVIDWNTPLAAIAGDNSAIAATIRNRVTAIGLLYDANGHPDVMTESAAHSTWRAEYADELAVRDRTAASVDGLPLTTIDPADPAASLATVDARLDAAASAASGEVAALIRDMQRSSLPVEPRRWIDAYYAGVSVFSSNGTAPALTFHAVGDIQAALIAALDELAAYVSFA